MSKLLPSSAAATIQIRKKLLDFVNFYTRYEKQPGFASVGFGLTYNRIQSILNNTNDPSSFSYNLTKNILRLKLTPSETNNNSKDSLTNDKSDNDNNGAIRYQSILHQQQLPILTKYMSIMDDITTWGLVLADTKQNRAGVSMNLTSYPGPALEQYIRQQQQQLSKPPTVELVSHITKVGKNVGFVQYEVHLIDPSIKEIINDTETTISEESSVDSFESHKESTKSNTSSIICYGSHIKYLPMGFLADIMLSNYGWNILQLYTKYILKPKDESKLRVLSTPATLFETFRYDPTTLSATFTATAHHASLGGTIHGGCQGMLMELIGTCAVEQIGIGLLPNPTTTVSNSNIRLESISVNFLSTPSRNVLLKVDQIIHEPSIIDDGITTNNSNNNKQIISLRVSLFSGKNTKINSIGHLRFSYNQQPPSSSSSSI